MSFFGGGSSQSQDQFQEIAPWDEARPAAVAALQQLYGGIQGYQPYSGSFYAGMNPQQQQALQQMQQYAGQMGGQVVDPAMQAWQAALNRPENITNDPGLQAMQEYYAQQTGQQFQDYILPGISGNAAALGHSGSTRMDLAQGLAADRAQEDIAGYNAGLLNNAYNQGIGQQTAALGMSPMMAQLGAAPSEALWNAGAMQQQDQQAQLDNAYRQYQQQVLAPINTFSQLSSPLAQYGQMGQETYNKGTGSAAEEPSGFDKLLGIGQLVGGGLMMMSGAGAAPGAAMMAGGASRLF